MTCSKKKRQYHRYCYESPVMIYTKELPDSSYYGRTYNSSQGGMYLETDADLEIGKFYVVKIIASMTMPEALNHMRNIAVLSAGFTPMRRKKLPIQTIFMVMA